LEGDECVIVLIIKYSSPSLVGCGELDLLEEAKMRKTLQFGEAGRDPWIVNCTDTSLSVSQAEIERLLDLIKDWAAFWVGRYPNEQTAVRRIYGVPSLMVRVDYTDTGVYEIDDRPCGIALTAAVCGQDQRNWLRVIAKNGPNFSVVVSNTRRGGDDHLWAPGGEISLDRALADKTGLVLPRCEPGQEGFCELESRSIAPLSLEGSKAYGVALGLWSEVRDIKDLPDAATPFCVKPFQGSKCMGVYVYHPSLKRKGRSGAVTRTKIETAAAESIATKGFVYMQPFHEPIQIDAEGSLWSAIKRLFFVYVPTDHLWVPFGGVWMGRPYPCVRVHGASDSISGPLTLPQSVFTQWKRYAPDEHAPSLGID
jgi:hypothetical protein